jgi:hypothetical protein
MKRSNLLAGFLVVASTAMWAGPRTPRVATIRESDGTLRPIWGLASNLVTGDALPIGKTEAAAFSDEAGIVLSRGAVRLVTLDGAELGAYATAEPTPVLSISGSANTAIAWLPSEGKLIRWDGTCFVSLRIDAAELPGTPVDIYLRDDRRVVFLLADGHGSLTRASAGLTEGPVNSEGSGVPPSCNNAIQIASLLMFQDAGSLRIESQKGVMKSLPFRETELRYERAGAMCIHLAASNGRQWLLQLSGVEPVLSEIPAVYAAGEAK